MQTIKQYLDALPTNMETRDGQNLRDTMANTMPIWSNDICRGYVVDAMNRANIDADTQTTILSALYESFDLLTYAEAEAKGR